MKRHDLGATCLMLAMLCTYGCEPYYDDESHWEEGAIGVLRQGLTVGEAGGCSTSILNALSEQLIEEINCLRPGTLRSFDGSNTSLGSAVFPFLQGQGPEDLSAAIDSRNQTLQVNSALRTLPQQFLLYRWYQQGRCNISLAARPGRSRHESGLAIDISDASNWIDTLAQHNFSWLGSDDPVHFDYQGGGITDLAGLSVRAFQQLWNRNHQEDLIAEDGVYGPQTEARILASPAEGFDISGCGAASMDLGIPLDMHVEFDVEAPPVDAEESRLADAHSAQRDWRPSIDTEVTNTDFGNYGMVFTNGDAAGPHATKAARLSGGCNQPKSSSSIQTIFLIFLGFIFARRRPQEVAACQTESVQ